MADYELKTITTKGLLGDAVDQRRGTAMAGYVPVNREFFAWWTVRVAVWCG